MSKFRRFFSAIKDHMAENYGNNKVFITGVSPISLNEFTSGFNIAVNLTHELDFSEICGFTKKDLGVALNSIKNGMNFEKMIIDNYDGYKFHSKQREKLINPQLCLYFLCHLQKYGEPPSNLMEQNCSMSDSVMEIISKMKHSKGIITKLLLKPSFNFSTSDKINEKLTVFKIFEEQSEHTTIQLLYYFGAFTICTANTVVIPNKIIRRST